MKLDEDFASIHAYLCADGYVIKNPRSQKHKYYTMGLRNTCFDLLNDFQTKFERVFKLKPKISTNQDRCKIGSKQSYYALIQQFGSFYSYEWHMPEEFKSRKAKSAWLRSFFDCEGSVIFQGHQSRGLTVDCVNETGIKQVQACLLNDFRIKSKLSLTNRDVFRLNIYGKENIVSFEKQIGFLHPKKKTRLREAINSYVDYVWRFPAEKEALKSFIKGLFVQKRTRPDKKHRIRVCSAN